MTVTDPKTVRLFMIEGVVGAEPAGLQKRSGDVVGEVAEAGG
jgi:hypothetical protein